MWQRQMNKAGKVEKAEGEISEQTPNERDARLHLMRTRQSEWLAAETTADRDARLQQISALQQEGLAAESAAERDIRLQQISALQQEGLALRVLLKETSDCSR